MTPAVLRAAVARAVWFVALLVGAVTFIELLMWASPGDAIDLLPNGAELRPALEREWGLDQPMPVRIWRRLSGAVVGDMGHSLTVRPGAPIAEMVAASALRSAQILLPSLLLSMLSAFFLARLTVHRGAILRRLVQALSVAPVFLLAWLLITSLNEVTFAQIQAEQLERPGWFALPIVDHPLRSLLAISVLAVGSSALSENHAEIEQELQAIENSGFIEAARARGAPTRPHIFSNLLAPLATLSATRMAFFVGGLVIIEKVMLLNGAGALMWDAALKRDYPLTAALALVAAAVVCGTRLASDLFRLVVDPRLRTRR